MLALLVEMKNTSSPLSLEPMPGEDMGMGHAGGLGANRAMGLKPHVMMEGPADIVFTRLEEYVTTTKKVRYRFISQEY